MVIRPWPKVRVGVGKALLRSSHFAGVGDFGPQVVFGPVVQLAVGKGVGAIERGGRLWSGQLALHSAWLPLMPPMASTTVGALGGLPRRWIP